MSLRLEQRLAAKHSQATVQSLIEAWEMRLGNKKKFPYPMELTSEVKKGLITDEIYRQRESQFGEFGLAFLQTELERLTKFHPTSANDATVKICEIGIGEGCFLSFVKSALDLGYSYELYDCSETARDTAIEILENLVIVDGRMKYDIRTIVRYGILHELLAEMNNSDEQFGLGIFLRVIQHNQEWIEEILPALPACTLPFGRVVLAHPYGEDNQQIEYSKYYGKSTTPFTRKFILDSINDRLPASAHWDYLREEKYFRGSELYTFSVLGSHDLAAEF